MSEDHSHWPIYNKTEGQIYKRTCALTTRLSKPYPMPNLKEIIPMLHPDSHYVVSFKYEFLTKKLG